jgi:hypothetical protein
METRRNSSRPNSPLRAGLVSRPFSAARQALVHLSADEVINAVEPYDARQN